MKRGEIYYANLVQAQQIRTLSKQRLVGKIIGQLSPEKMQSIDSALRLHLNL